VQLLCNSRRVGEVEHVEWKSEDDGTGTVTFMAPFEFDWSAKSDSYLELLSEDGSERCILQEIRRADEGDGGRFVVAEFKRI